MEKKYIKKFRSAHPLTLELQRTESRNHSIFGAINLIIEYNRPQIPAADKFVISALQCTFSIYVHSLAVVLLWCDRTSEQSSRSAAPQRALPCCLRRPHKDPEGTEVTVRWLDWKARSYLLANSGCLIVQPTTISCVFKIFHVCSQHGGDHGAAVCIISYWQSEESFILGDGGSYLERRVTALCLIRSGWFNLGCYLKTESWAAFQPTPLAMALKGDAGKSSAYCKIARERLWEGVKVPDTTTALPVSLSIICNYHNGALLQIYILKLEPSVWENFAYKYCVANW